jgi:hypothetical protein
LTGFSVFVKFSSYYKLRLNSNPPPFMLILKAKNVNVLFYKVGLSRSADILLGCLTRGCDESH